MNRTRITLAAAMVTASAFGVLANGTLTGRVISRETNEPVDFADVRLTDAVTGKPTAFAVQTDGDGVFRFESLPDGSYVLTVSNLGSVSQERPVKIAGADIELPVIHLADDTKMLQEVVVTGIKGQMSFELDRKVFNVDANIDAAGASASELLESIPSVEVDQEGSVSLRGNSSVTIWINGKDSGLTADNQGQILEQIPAETIEKIEVITNPSAKYSPEGTAGIINIVLRKDRRAGYFGSAEVAANTRGGGNVNFNINYNSGKFDTFAGIGFRMRHNKGESSSRREYADGWYLNSDGENRNHGNNVFLRLGGTYHLTSSDDIYLNAFGMLGHRWGRSLTEYESDVPGQWLTNTNISHNRGDMRGAHAELGYTHKFTDTHSIDMNIGFNRWGGPGWTSYLQEQVFADSRDNIYQEQTQSNNVNSVEAKVDYTNQVLPWLKLEAGYNGNYNHENSPVVYWQGTTPADMKLAEDLYNTFLYTNNISALYVTMGGKVKNFSFSAGLRSEAWQVRTRSLEYGQTKEDVTPYKKNNFALFPSAFLSWSLPHDNELQINYTRRIRRPWGPQLNSFKNISDPTEIHMGNPELQPEYSNAFELNYLKSWTYHMISVSAYVRQSSDMISHVSFMAPSPVEEGVMTVYSGHANVGNQTNSGCEIVLKDNFFRMLDVTTTVNLYNNHISAWEAKYPLDGKFYDMSAPKQDHFAWDIRCMAALRLPWNMSLQLTGRYNSRTLTAQGSREPGWDVQAGLRKTAGNWSFSINCRDVFDSRRRHSFTHTDEWSQESKRQWGGRSVRFTIKYSFGNMKAKANKADKPGDINSGGYDEMGE